jgi:two-component system LytT family response regulator
MQRAIIVDDELKSCESLKVILNEFCSNVRVVQMVHTVKDALTAIQNCEPDVVFLDIHLNSETGFDLLERIDEINFDIIFITAFPEHALKAIKYSAIDYLLKPINIDDLKAAIDKLKKAQPENNIRKKVNLLIQSLNRNKQNRLAVPVADGITFLSIDEIIYCEGSSNYTNFCLQNGKKYLVAKTLKEYEEMLSNHNFLRIHNSYLVNVNEIRKYFKGDGGYVLMSNDDKLDVSKRKKEYFLKKMSNVNLL